MGLFDWFQSNAVEVKLKGKVVDFARPDYEKKTWIGSPKVDLYGTVKRTKGVGGLHPDIDVIVDGKKSVVRCDAGGNFSLQVGWLVTEAKSHVIEAKYDHVIKASAKLKLGCYQLYCALFVPEFDHGGLTIMRKDGRVDNLVYQGIAGPDMMAGCQMMVASLVLPIIEGTQVWVDYETTAPQASIWHYVTIDEKRNLRYPQMVGGSLRIPLP